MCYIYIFYSYISFPKKPWQKFINNDNAILCNNEALDLLSKMLIYDHANRVLPKEAMEHEYFAPVREYHSMKEKEKTINIT